jgi:PAS domain S-box-containing protein
MTRVLILDDRPINRQVLTTLLSYKGFETREAVDGVEGLEIAREWPPDLAIVDAVMPRMDGVEFVRQLRNDPQLSATPVIFYTASYDLATARQIGKRSGVEHVLMKPSEPEVILKTIDLALARSRTPPPPPNETAIDRVQTAAMRAGALIDFQLEIAAQRSAREILEILARTARNIIASEHSIVEVGNARFVGCNHPKCGVAAGPARIRVPIETAAQRYGWLTLVGDGYDADDERIALTIVAQAAIAYENLKLYDELRMEAELLDRNVNLLHATIEASGEGILVVSPDSKFVTFNEKFGEILRLPDDIIASGDSDRGIAFTLERVTNPAAFRAMIQRVRDGGEGRGTFEMIDGRFIECHGEQRRIDGEIIGRVWSFRDVTARVQAEEALRQSEQKYRTLVANVPDVIWTADSAGRILFVSPNVEAMLGYTAEELMANGDVAWTSRIHRNDLVRTMESYLATFEKRLPFDSEFRFRRKDGRWIWIHGSALGAYESDGVLRADGVLHDITARKESEEQLRRVARERELLLESTGEGIFAVDVHGICTMANRMAAHLLGRVIDELTGTKINELIHPHGAPFAVSTPMRVADDSFLRRDGSAFPVEYVASPIVDGGGVRGTVVSFTDITERRRLEQRLEQISRIDSLGRMAATIAHEFNNVLMGIQPFAEVIRRRAGADESLQKAAGHIMNSVARGKSVTQDILRMSKAAEPQLRSVELVPWLEQLAAEIRALVGPRINVELDVPAWDRLWVRCDPAQMQQVLTNLAVNARDAMSGIGTLRVLAERAGSAIRMVVSDTGSGIDAATLPYIFEPLFTTKHSGTGLGLAVAQQIVVRNGGTIGVESAPGEGTRFTIEIPATQPPAEQTGDGSESELAQLGISRVLIVEDDPSVASGLAAILEAEGVAVHVVVRGEEATRAAASFAPDVAIIDVSLPDMNGAEVYAELARRWPEMGVIFSTGHAEESRLPQMGGERVAFLRKPYGSEALLRKLREVIVSAESRTTP